MAKGFKTKAVYVTVQIKRFIRQLTQHQHWAFYGHLKQNQN